MLRDYFPNTSEGAHIYGGFLYDETLFCKTFPCEDSITKMLIPINEFLDKNGYATILPNEIENEGNVYEKGPISLSPHGYQNEFVLFIKGNLFLNLKLNF